MKHMITTTEALTLIDGNSKHHHSIMVGKIMRELASRFDADEGLWELVGILHDLDYDETKEDRSKHGLLAATCLEGMLPIDGLNAIKRHDHRSGYKPVTSLDMSLVFADALSVLIEDGHLTTMVSEDEVRSKLCVAFDNKPWLRNLIEDYSQKLEVEIYDILENTIK